MPRLTISIPDNLYKRLLLKASEKNESLSKVINDLMLRGDESCDERQSSPSPIEQHCQQLIMQMNAMIKNLAVNVLKLDQKDFDQLHEAMIVKYNHLTSKGARS